MSKKIGYIDESGDKSIHYEKGGVTTFFIVSAVIIDENSVDKVRNDFIKIAKKHTQAPEIKSNAKAFRKIENRLEWFNDFEANEDQIESLIKENFKDLLKYDDKYDQYSAYFDVSYAYYKYGNAVFKDYVSGEDEHTNTTYTFLNGKLEKGSVLDIAFCVRSLNIDLSNNEYRVRGATERIHYIGHDSKFTETKPLPGVLPGDYDSNQLNLGKRQSHEQAGGKYCEVYYGESDGEKQFKFNDPYPRLLRVKTC